MEELHAEFDKCHAALNARCAELHWEKFHEDTQAIALLREEVGIAEVAKDKDIFMQCFHDVGEFAEESEDPGCKELEWDMLCKAAESGHMDASRMLADDYYEGFAPGGEDFDAALRCALDHLKRGRIKNANDEIAGTIMPASNLAIFAFRLALTLVSGKRGFVDTPSVQRIRLLSVKGDEENLATCSIVDELYNNGGRRLREIIETVEAALRVYKREGDPTDGLPAVIRTSIILNSPDVYLLLLYMAYKGRIGDFGNVAGIATWLHWFSVEQQKKIVDEIKDVVDYGDLASLKRLVAGLCESRALM